MSSFLESLSRALTVLGLVLAVPVQAQPPPAHIVKVVGDRHKLALESDGTVIGWGLWQRAQLGPLAGIGATSLWTSRPIAIELPGKAVDVAAGEGTSYALLEDGSVWAWGEGAQGELGTGPNPALPVLAHSTSSMQYRGVERPVRVAIDNVGAIEAAGRKAVAILRDGTVRQWPRHREGNGRPVFLPVAVPHLERITQLSASESHVLALTSDGRVWGWGSNLYGALGQEPRESFNDPVAVPGLADVTAIAAAEHVSLVVRRDGTVWVWGSNGQGQFGNGKRASHPSVDTTSVPQQVPGIAGAVAISAGLTGRHVIVRLEDGTIRGWGNTDFGQIGAGLTTTFQLTPVAPKIANVRAVFAVGNNTFAVRADHSFWGWGHGDPREWPLRSWTRVPTAIVVP